MIGLVGAGAMGSAMGASWRAGGADVVTCVEGRSARTRALVEQAGLRTVPRAEVVGADLVVSIVPPDDAMAAARSIAEAATAAGVRPLVADLNAIAPTTAVRIGEALRQAGLDFVDGSISGPPPGPRRHRSTRLYLSGERAREVGTIENPWAEVFVLSDEVGQASALKMCTASVYKGTNALIMHALLTAAANGVVEEFLADVSRTWPEQVPGWPLDIALAASKSARYVGEMREIARAQAAAGLPAELFEGVAAAYERASETRLGRTDPEDVPRTVSLAEVLGTFRETEG
ncbi:NAD(P)-binding domain-containing protein [Amycolatopsis pigmentata]|uniref:NAD(P)-binding domain-containing protein n=1 Tax=Amycolatopsis pigmentata TaxID=450801 RepID=A0ABW5G0J0_9PSEU